MWPALLLTQLAGLWVPPHLFLKIRTTYWSLMWKRGEIDGGATPTISLVDSAAVHSRETPDYNPFSICESLNACSLHSFSNY